MQLFWWGVTVLLLLALLTGLAGILWRSSTVERVMAVQLLGTSGIGILLVLGVSLPLPVLVGIGGLGGGGDSGVYPQASASGAT